MTDDRQDAARDVARLWTRLTADDIACPPEFAAAMDRLAAAHGFTGDPLDGPLLGVPYVADPEMLNTYRPQSS